MAEVKDRTRNWSSGKIKRRPVHRRQDPLTPGERRRLTQLVVCILLFSIVFLGRGLPNGNLSVLGNSVNEWIHKDTDFRAAFSKVGQSVSEGEPFVETFGVLWSEVFGNGKEVQSGGEDQKPVSTPPDQKENTEVAPIEQQNNQNESKPPAEQENKENVEKKTETKTETKTEKSANKETTDKGSKLLQEKTVAPVMGVLTSGFGYRIHPIDGQWKRHDGIDIMANEGTPILAFASGVVDFVGESPAYGLYLQLKHSNGVSSFYAHCSEICVKKGQKVGVGEVIAKVGVTGNTTGAHLHFEIKKNGERVDPALYVQTKAQ